MMSVFSKRGQGVSPISRGRGGRGGRKRRGEGKEENEISHVGCTCSTSIIAGNVGVETSEARTKIMRIRIP